MACQASRRAANGRLVHGTDVALFLGEDQVRAQLREQCFVQLVQAARLLAATSASISALEAAPGIRLRVRWGSFSDPVRVVAFVGHADQVAASTQGADQLGERREQADDPHDEARPEESRSEQERSVWRRGHCGGWTSVVGPTETIVSGQSGQSCKQPAQVARR